MTDAQMTFSTALDIDVGGEKFEIDFAAWYARDNWDNNSEPVLILGEAKSLGQGNLIKRKDVERMRRLASLVAPCVVVFSVLRDEFTADEKALLAKFAQWCFRPNSLHKQITPIFLTGNELLFEFSLDHHWKKLSEKDDRFKHFGNVWSLDDLSYRSARVYLDVDPWEVRRRHRAAVSKS